MIMNWMIRHNSNVQSSPWNGTRPYSRVMARTARLWVSHRQTDQHERKARITVLHEVMTPVSLVSWFCWRMNSELHSNQWSASRTGRFTPGTHFIGGWVGSRAGLDAVAKGKIPFPSRESLHEIFSKRNVWALFNFHFTSQPKNQCSQIKVPLLNDMCDD
jgi:hypothetical protein